MAKALTPASIDRLKAPEKRVEIPDPALAGLYLVHQPSGAKSWAVRYRHDGKPRKMTLGRWPIVGLADARLAASEALAAVEEGRDPGTEKIVAKKERADQIDRNAFSARLEQFANRHLSKLKTGAQNKAALDAWALPRWQDRDVRTITRRDIIDLLDDIVDEGKETTANRVRAYLSKFFGYLVERDVIEVSPVLGIKPPAKEKVRDRVLSDDEIRWFWQACDQVGYPWGPVGKMLLTTGQRLSEVTGITESELDGETWFLPGFRTKNKRAHSVPLSDTCKAVLSGTERVYSPAGLLFTTTGETPVSGHYKARNNINKRMLTLAKAEKSEPVEIPHWTFHDLRRTAATGMARLGIPVRVTEAVLNHVSGTGGGIVAVYQRHDYADEKRRALEAWARFVMQIVEGGEDNVVKLGAGK